MGLRATGGAIAQDLAKLHAIQASAAELNLLMGKTNLDGFYAKIRDIPNANGTLISIDLSDINWNIWREIRIESMIVTTSADLAFRINNSSSTYYSYSQIASNSSTIQGLGYTDRLGAISIRPTQITVSIRKTGSYLAFEYSVVVDSNPTQVSYSGIGSFYMTAPPLTTFNIFQTSGSVDIAISDAELWGIKK